MFYFRRKRDCEHLVSKITKIARHDFHIFPINYKKKSCQTLLIIPAFVVKKLPKHIYVPGSGHPGTSRLGHNQFLR